MFGFKRTAIVGGFPFTVRRDAVEGYTTFRHPHDKRSINKAGLFPYLSQGDDGVMTLRVRLTTGAVKQIRGLHSIIVNLGGKLVTCDSGIEQHFEASNQKYFYYLDHAADAAWIDALGALDEADSAVMRFKGQLLNYDYDLEIPGWNRRLVADVMTAYKKLMEIPVVQAQVGPFSLFSDGSIQAQQGAFRVEPGASVEKTTIEGCNLESQRKGLYVILDAGGTAYIATFETERWNLTRT